MNMKSDKAAFEKKMTIMIHEKLTNKAIGNYFFFIFTQSDVVQVTVAM